MNHKCSDHPVEGITLKSPFWHTNDMQIGAGSKPRRCSRFKDDSKEILGFIGSSILQHAVSMSEFIGLSLKITEVF
jgi:hypothetical protein